MFAMFALSMKSRATEYLNLLLCVHTNFIIRGCVLRLRAPRTFNVVGLPDPQYIDIGTCHLKTRRDRIPARQNK